MSSLETMNEPALRLYLSNLLKLRRARAREGETFAMQISVAESALHRHNELTGVLDFQIEFVHARLVAIECTKTKEQDLAGGKPEPEVHMET